MVAEILRNKNVQRTLRKYLLWFWRGWHESMKSLNCSSVSSVLSFETALVYSSTSAAPLGGHWPEKPYKYQLLKPYKDILEEHKISSNVKLVNFCVLVLCFYSGGNIDLLFPTHLINCIIFGRTSSLFGLGGKFQTMINTECWQYSEIQPTLII